ncbi:hypothetical protein TC41_1746 [Alicyclobacillus acidocaldarius subsp. acidocaldarius Tc-4-1]|uniref:Lipoprotein n=1 Tax=Alicyclobacillus acidocaldarius (strain Tc-4-1) TaxID=1048834 RepID=F8ILA7_ALIAT|nr:hypothetical protein TC41_1746 [Alicyclobacillus acidocaldarius subsp. acidocaldarius Tc-4-1]
MFNVNKWTGWSLAFVTMGAFALTGCGTHPTSNASNTIPVAHTTTGAATFHTHSVAPAKEIPVPTKSLPVKVTQHLKPYASRLEHVTSLPVTVPRDTQNVLVISALTAYAIPQFQQVWSQLSSKPAVVWVGLTQAQTEQVWKQAGYSSDPLPSPVTLYESISMPVPIAYHRVNNGWEAVPGILPPSQAHDWVAFFEGATSR